jgi:signal transduction histidine kinase
MSNAIKYGTSEISKVIEVGVVQADSPAIYIRDFGGGIDLRRFGNQMFKPGKRFHANRDGQGLGLYMTKHQIESAGGSITVESEPNKGATFTVYFGS